MEAALIHSRRINHRTLSHEQVSLVPPNIVISTEQQHEMAAIQEEDLALSSIAQEADIISLAAANEGSQSQSR